MFTCTGDGADHCCYLDGKPCPHLEEGTVPGRRWACGLLRQTGTWAAVAADPRYRPIGEHWQSIGQPFNYCETFIPTEGACCG